jgi:hypothetical protein
MIPNHKKFKMATSLRRTLMVSLAVIITGALASTPRPSFVAHSAVGGDHSHYQTTTVLFNSDLEKSGYTDGAFLFDFHQRVQREKLSEYEASSTDVNNNDLWNLARHNSFVQNDLADFVPPLTDNLHVLTIGDENSGGGGERLKEFPGGDAEPAILDAAKDDNLDQSSKDKPAITASQNIISDTPDTNVFAFLGNLLKMNKKKVKTAAAQKARRLSLSRTIASWTAV